MFSLKLIHSHNSEFFILYINQNTAYSWIWNLHFTTLLTYVACYHPVISTVPLLNPKTLVETYFKLYSLCLSLAVPCNWMLSEREGAVWNELVGPRVADWTPDCEQFLKGLRTTLSQCSACLRCGVPVRLLSHDYKESIHSVCFCI